MILQIVLFSFVILSDEVLSKRDRIIGGESADIEEYPYLVSLRLVTNNSHRHVCGGTIISDQHVLTAAHCISEIQNVQSNVKVYAGSTYLSSDSPMIYDILRPFIHPKFTGRITTSSCLKYDIAILMLSSNIIFSNFIKKAELPTRDVRESDTGSILGWGAYFYPARSLSDQLQVAPMSVVTHNQCSQLLGYRLQHRQFCAFNNEGIGACTGDSGGPFVSNGQVIGINSLVIPCAIGVPDIYTKVYSYLSYIRAILDNSRGQ